MIGQLSDNIWRVGGGPWDGSVTGLTSEGSNTYLVKLGESATLIDCGCVKCKGQVETNIREANVAPEQVKDLILTHSHWDHSEATAAWREDYGLRVHLNDLGTEFLTKDDLRLTGAYKNGPDHGIRAFPVDNRMMNDEPFMAGMLIYTPVFAPGHTPDSTLITAEIDGKHVGFCGDVTFARNAAGKLGTIGWLDMLWQSSLSQYKDSLRRMSRMTFDLLLPGHGNPIVGREDAKEAIAASLATVEHLSSDPWISSFGTVAD